VVLIFGVVAQALDLMWSLKLSEKSWSLFKRQRSGGYGTAFTQLKRLVYYLNSPGYD